jgi:biotin carboxyl carrier protein
MCNHGGMIRVEPLMDAAPVDSQRYAGEVLTVPERVVIAPCIGHFRSAPPETVTAEGEVVATGQVVGYIDAQGRTIPVRSSFAGWMMGLMVREGDRVREGQPVAWLRSL